MPSSTPCVLVVADPGRVRELTSAFAEPLPGGPVEVLASSGGDDTIEMFEARAPRVVVVTASLDVGDAGSLIEALRAMAPGGAVAIVLVGDDERGQIRTARDAVEFAPDRFVGRPLEAGALRAAVQAGLGGGARASHDGHATPGTGAGAPGGGLHGRDPSSPGHEPDAVGASSLDDTAPTVPPVDPAPYAAPARYADARPPASWRSEPAPEAGDELESPTREPTLIIPDEIGASDTPGPRERWSEPVLLAQLVDRSRDSSRALLADAEDEIARLDRLDRDLLAEDGDHAVTPPPADNPTRVARPPASPVATSPDEEPTSPAAGDAAPDRPAGRDFARQLRAKMSQMAARLFQGDGPVEAPQVVDLRPRHDHHTEIDLASLGEELTLDRGVTEIEGRAREAVEVRPHTTSPGSWDTQQIRERGLPDAGEMVRGLSDAPAILARMFSVSLTGRVVFRRDQVEKIVYFDQGRPVFASSSDPGDRMGALLVREGKITATQYERCQAHVAQSGRRMGESLVDFGYLKRRELLPAVRRHVEDTLYSLFGWDHGVYQVMAEPAASAERIRLSRHPASIVLEGIRRKLGRATLDRLLGPSSTVLEIPDRERLASIVNVGDLSLEERAALSAFDGQADLAQVARIANVDVADLLPLAWGLCVLGLANARRTEADALEESNALIGETDLAIDRERVRARYLLVEEADYFALLGVRRDATAFEIRRAYQAARRDFAADGFPPDLRREMARELEDIATVLDEAYRVLRDEPLRQSYLTNLIDAAPRAL